MEQGKMLLKNKKILVVGAAGLLGREIVSSIINEGGRVIAADVDKKALNTFLEKYTSDQLQTIGIDITSKESITKVFQIIDDSWGGFDGAVNTAYPRNSSYGRKVFDVTFEDFSENLGLHLGGYFLFMQQCAVYAKEKSSALSLVSLSSIYGVMAPRFEIYEGTNMTMAVEYAAIKSGLLHLNKYFTNFMKGTGFRSNSVSPGGLLDGQDETFLEKYNAHCIKKGMLNPEDITGAINFLLSDRSKYMSGQNLVVDDGFST
jgi:NAD(P)-dependent dehydrogenase (short-subunit alcohol dehydrogenase family)